MHAQDVTLSQHNLNLDKQHAPKRGKSPSTVPRAVPTGKSNPKLDDMTSPFLRALDTLKDQAKDALWAVTSCICQPSAKIKINGRTCAFSFFLLSRFETGLIITCLFSSYAVKIIKVLGEGGFSFVYLAQDETSGVSSIPFQVLSKVSDFDVSIDRDNSL